MKTYRMRCAIVLGMAMVRAMSAAAQGECFRLNINPSVLASGLIAGTPVGVATDASGNVVAVSAEGEVYSLTATCAMSTPKALPAGGQPVAITMSNTGNVYVARDDGKVHRLNLSLDVLTTVTVSGTPVDVALDASGLVYVVTSGGTIHKRQVDLGPLTTGSVSGTPTAIFVNATGDVFVTTSGGSVHRLPTGLSGGSSGTVPGGPVDVAANGTGTTVVASADGTVHTISNSIVVLQTRTLSGALVGVDLDEAGNVAVANSQGTVFVVNTGLSSHSSTLTGTSLRGVTINLTGSIYAVGGVALPPGEACYSTGSVTIGQVNAGLSGTGTFTVENCGGEDLQIQSVVVNTADPGVWGVSPTGPLTLTAGQVQPFTVTMTVPSGLTADVSYSANIVVTTDDAVNPPVTTIGASGVGHALLGAACYSTSSLLLGQVDAGMNTSGTFTVQNCGEAPLQVQSVAINTADPGVWTATPNAPVTLAPSQIHTVTVTMTVPTGLTADAAYAADIVVTTDDQVNPPVVTITASGTGRALLAEACYDKSGLPLGQVDAGMSTSGTFTIENCGEAPLQILSVVLTTADIGVWAVSPTGSATLTPGQTYTITVTMTVPSGLTADVSYAASVVVTTDDQVNPPATTITATGAGHVPVPEACYSTSTMSFGLVNTGTADSRTFTLVNCGGADMQVQSVVLTTADPLGTWGVVPTTTATMTPGQSRTFTVTLTVPAGLTSDVAYSGTVTVTTDDQVNPPVKNITLSGTGHVPVAKACYSPSSLLLGQVNAGVTGAATFTLENCGDADLDIQSVVLNTTDPPGIWSVTPTVPGTLTPGQVQTFTVSMAVPAGLTSDTPYNATIEVTTTDQVNSPVKTIAANGTGHVQVSQIEIAAQYPDRDFGDVEIGYQNSLPLVIRNNGDLALTFDISYVDAGDPDIGEFDLGGSIGSHTVAANGGETTFQLKFMPTSSGAKSLYIRVDNANDLTFDEQAIHLHGNGTTPVPIDAVLLLDRSGSMAQTAGELIKIDALSSASVLFTELLRDNIDYLGLTRYNHNNDNILDLGPITAVRTNAQSLLSQTTGSGVLNPTGATGIGGAMETGSSQYALSPVVTPPDPDHRKVMVVLTDGHENQSPYINDILNGYGSYPGLFVEHPQLHTYSVGLGLPSNVNQSRLQEITNRGPGGFYLVTGNLEGTSLFNLELFYLKIFADGIGQTMVVDPTYSIAVGETLEVPIGIITDDHEAQFFFIGEFPASAYAVELLDPNNTIVGSSAAGSGMAVQVKSLNNWILIRIKFPAADVNTDYVGTWKFRVRLLDPKMSHDSATTRAFAERVLAMPTNTISSSTSLERHRVAFAASVGSDYKIHPSPGLGAGLLGEPLRLRVTLTEAGWPSTTALVVATVTNPDGTSGQLQLTDDGGPGDDLANDGVFGGSYTNTHLSGTYQVEFRSSGTTSRGENVTRVATRSYFLGPSPDDPSPRICRACPWKGRVGVLTGANWPISTLATTHDPSFLIAAEVDFPIASPLGIGVQVGYRAFDADPATTTDNLGVTNVSAFARVVRPLGIYQPFLVAGIGAYHASGTWNLGVQAATGVDARISARLALVVGVDVHLVPRAPTDLRWIGAYLGFRMSGQ